MAASRFDSLSSSASSSFEVLLGHLIREADLSYRETAERLGCDISHISNVLNSKRGVSREFVVKVAVAFSLSAGDRETLFESAGYASDDGSVVTLAIKRLRNALWRLPWNQQTAALMVVEDLATALESYAEVVSILRAEEQVIRAANLRSSATLQARKRSTEKRWEDAGG